jgi:oligosaccharide 4-alpha-D-glucosyltransferase
MINMSLSGMPFIHADAGGFAQGIKDNELYTRWLQFACFSPILRPHGSGIPSEPVFFNDTTQRIVRYFMDERYRLLPYLYTATWQAHKNGTPIIRPLFFAFPKDSATYSVMDEYLWGDDFLVAPILHKKVQQRRLYLPDGLWYDWWSSKKYKGGRWINFPVNLETIPVFIRAGAFIPMVKAVESTDDYSSKDMTIRFYPAPEGKSSEGQMYEDDGKTFGAYEKGEYELLRFQNVSGKTFLFSRTGKQYEGMPLVRHVKFEIMSSQIPEHADFKFIERDRQQKIHHKKAGSQQDLGWYYDKDKRCIVIDFVWSSKTVSITIK